MTLKGPALDFHYHLSAPQTDSKKHVHVATEQYENHLQHISTL